MRVDVSVRERGRAKIEDGADKNDKVKSTSAIYRSREMSHASSHSTTSSKSPSLSRSKAGGPPRDIEDDRERLVRNRLRWLEGNWDGRMPPSKSPPPTAGEDSIAHGYILAIEVVLLAHLVQCS